MGKTIYTINKDSPSINGTVGNEKKIEDEEEPTKISKFRTILPQILASTAKNFLLLDLGMAVAFPTIVIPALSGLKNRAPDEFLTFSAVQASWFGSIAFICQPVGSVLSGIVLEPLGRKKSMILVNIPHIIGWLMLHFAGSLEEMYIAAVLLGLGVGFMEAPIVTYVGEICQPSIRGILTSCAGVAVTLGFFIVYLLGTVTTWRNTALICMSVPVLTMIAICFVPETPMWLLGRGRKEDAQKSLQWLRGWVSPQHVQKEFEDIQRYSSNSSKCTPCQKAKSAKCDHPAPSEFEKLKELTRKRTLKPFILVMTYFAFVQFTGLPGMRPYLVQIFQAYGLPVDASWATVSIGLIGFCANITCMMLIKFAGKRKLSLVSMSATSLCCLGLAIYAFKVFPIGWKSFDKHTVVVTNGGFSYIPMMLFFVMAFASSVGITPVPWILLSEVFPFKSRSMACGITAALNYIMTFITTKTYFNLENALSLPGVILFYGIIGAIGTIFIYFFLPETEKRTLEDIEIYFSDNNRKLTDINIKRNNIGGSNNNNSDVETAPTPQDTEKKVGIQNIGFVEN